MTTPTMQIRIASLVVTRIPHGGERRLRAAIQAQLAAMLARRGPESPDHGELSPEVCSVSRDALRHTDALADHLACHLHPIVTAHAARSAR